MSISMSYWRFIVFWSLFSLITGLILRKALEKPLLGSTPRYVIAGIFIAKASTQCKILHHVVYSVMA